MMTVESSERENKMDRSYITYGRMGIALLGILFVFLTGGSSRSYAKELSEEVVLEEAASETLFGDLIRDILEDLFSDLDVPEEEAESGEDWETWEDGEDPYASFHIAEKELEVPDIEEEYSFLFLSDTHVIKLNGTEEEQIVVDALPRREVFRDERGIISLGNFPRWMEYANENEMDMVLFGGDIIDYPSEENLAVLEKNLESLEMPYVYTLGNHDWTYSWAYMTPEGREEYRPLFEPFTGENTAASITECGELVILGVDNSSNQVEPEALPVVEEALSLGKPVIIVMHVPFSTQTLLEKASTVWENAVSVGMEEEGGISLNENTDAFREMIFAEDSPVVCVLAGHVHFPDEGMLTEDIVQYVNGAGYLNEGIVLRVHGKAENEEE